MRLYNGSHRKERGKRENLAFYVAQEPRRDVEQIENYRQNHQEKSDDIKQSLARVAQKAGQKIANAQRTLKGEFIRHLRTAALSVLGRDGEETKQTSRDIAHTIATQHGSHLDHENLILGEKEQKGGGKRKQACKDFCTYISTMKNHKVKHHGSHETNQQMQVEKWMHIDGHLKAQDKDNRKQQAH